jgi:hypothetical protein
MNEMKLRIYGSDEDLDALRAALENAGIKEEQENIIRASQTAAVLVYVCVAFGPELIRCVRDFLVNRKRVLISRTVTPGKVATTIIGTLPDEVIKEALKDDFQFIIADNAGQPGQKKIPKTLKNRGT